MSSQDIIFINGLTVSTTIGVYAWEQSIKQKVILDIEIFTDIIAAAKTDNIDKTINYKELSDSITEFLSNSSFSLIETLATKVVDLILENPLARKVKIKLHKPKALTNATNVGVWLERENLPNS